MKNYSKWFKEIEKTKLDRSHGGVKIYKLILLLCMMDRGVEDWYKPVTPDEIALSFYRYLTDNEKIVITSFSDKENKKYHDIFDKTYFTYIIKNNPMKYWGGTKSYKYAQFDGTRFRIDLEIDPDDKEYVYAETRKTCLARIERETGERFDVKIELEDEYKYQLSRINSSQIAETEKEAYVMTRIGQGKFRNRLMERYRNCPICKVENKELLIASHIKPWKDCNHNERLDVNNGFIFCPNHDKLFDLGFISFNNDGQILISNRNIPSDSKRLRISESVSIPTNLENQKYLWWHREKVFLK